MSDKKNIDRLFQEKFKDFEAIPNDNVWKGIEAKLQNKEKKKRRVIPFWWTIGAAAAAILLLFTFGNLIFEINTINKQSIVDTKNTEVDKVKKTNSKNNSNETSISKSENTSETPIKNTNTSTINQTQKQLLKSNIVNQNKNTIAFKNSENKNKSEKRNATNTNSVNKTQTKVAKNVNLKKSDDYKNISHSNETKPLINSEKNTNTIASNRSNDNVKKDNSIESQIKSNEEIKALLNSSNKNNNAVVKSNKEDNFTNNKEEKSTLKENKKQSIEEAIAEANTENEEEKERRRWSIAPNVAPVYFNSLGKGSSLDAQFANNSNNSNITVSYGLKGSYAINKRLKITTGVNRVNFSNTTNDVIALSSKGFSATISPIALNSAEQPVNDNLSNVQLNINNNDGSLVLLSRANVNFVPESINATGNGDLNQTFGFIEIPLELDYRVIDKKLGLNISGGFSTLFLNENEISASVDGQNTRIGKANNISDTSFSANFGVGLDYNISEKVNISLEPKFKYQLNTFKNTAGDFRPFFIGVYTGLSFKF